MADICWGLEDVSLADKYLVTDMICTRGHVINRLEKLITCGGIDLSGAQVSVDSQWFFY